MSGEPVTTSPLLIMIINMTIVFVVLYLLGLVIRFIHMIDPTKPKADAVVDVGYDNHHDAAAPESAATISDKELAAVILTAIIASGYHNVQIKSIKKI